MRTLNMFFTLDKVQGRSPCNENGMEKAPEKFTKFIEYFKQTLIHIYNSYKFPINTEARHSRSQSE